MDGACVETSECGCLTDDGASVAEGWSHEECAEICTCENGVYNCQSKGDGTCVQGCGNECECTMKRLLTQNNGLSQDDCEYQCQCTGTGTEMMAVAQPYSNDSKGIQIL